jgi:HEPN domain-containing protein
MASGESSYPQDWLRIAERDLTRVARSLRDEDPAAGGYFLQQAVEKLLKAFLLSKGWRLRRIHDLEALLDDAVKYDVRFEEYRSLCQQATGYYLVERYPLGSGASPSVGEVREALGVALRLADQVRGFV